MTNVPFLNSVTNVLSKNDVKGLELANALMDITEGNEKLDDLLTLQASASKIDNSVNTYVNVLDFNSGAKTSSSLNKAIEFARANNIWTVYIPNGEYDLLFAENADIPSFPVGQKVPSLWLPSNIRLLGESRKGVI